MRQHHRSKHASARNIKPPLFSGLLVGVSVLALGFSSQAIAQEQPVVDLTDPNVSVDLSVLNDGGLAPQMGAPMPAATTAMTSGAGGYQPPGANMPVSTLYIQPSGGFTLPPQTKSIEAQPAAPKPVKTATAPEAAPEMAPVEATPDEPVVAEAPMEEAPLVETPVVETPVVEAPVVEAPVEAVKAEPAPAPEPAPVETTKAEPAPVVEAPAVEAEAEPVKPVEIETAEPAPAPQPMETVKVAPEAVAEPEAQTPPPPPQALVKPETQPVSKPAPATQQPAPENARPSTVVDLPPKTVAPGVASLPDASGPLGDGDSMRIVFDRDSSKLPPDARDALGTLAKQMLSQDGLRLQLLAYAGNADTSASAARRLSLSRALAVRSYLIESGVRSTRIDVRALGNKSSEDVTERVDITVMER